METKVAGENPQKKNKKKVTRYFIDENKQQKTEGQNKPSTGEGDTTKKKTKNRKRRKKQVQGESGGKFPSERFGDKKDKFSDKVPKGKGGKVKKAKHGKTDKLSEDRIKAGFREDDFDGPAPIPREKIKKYKRGHKIHLDTITTGFHQDKMKQKEKSIKKAVKQSARSELLLQEQAGLLEAEEGEMTAEVSQYDVVRATDITSATKFFSLSLNQFGPYCMNYSRNGRQLLLGGAKGHVAALDWQTKKLMCEINVMETIQDVKWLHIETMFAVAQKRWVYIYDNQGIELHCLKYMNNVLQLEFLPYHFLLAAASSTGYIHWLDVSMGKKVATFHANQGRLGVMCQNPSNAILITGHSGGTVTMWSPNVREPLLHMLCHSGAVRAINVHHTGNYMATSSVDRKIKIWDLRMMKQLYAANIGTGASSLSFSQRGLLAASLGNTVEVYRDVCNKPIVETYMSHRVNGSVKNLQFCPYEDVLGVAHERGFTSLLIPGAGEPNFDAYEANPFQSKTQRREMEVKMLLDKIQPDMIDLDTSSLSQMDVATVQEDMQRKAKLLYLKPQKIEFEPRHRTKGRSKTGNLEHRKIGVKMERKMDEIKQFIKDKEKHEKQLKSTEKSGQRSEQFSVFNRFKKSNA